MRYTAVHADTYAAADTLAADTNAASINADDNAVYVDIEADTDAYVGEDDDEEEEG